MAQVIETVFSIRTEESVANLNEVVNSLGRTEQAAKRTARSVSDEVAKIPAATKRATSGFNGLSNSINQVSRELPAFAFSAQTGFLAISNNIPILVDEIGNLRKANALLVAEGKASIPIWKLVTGALFSWQTALSVGISLSVLYAKEIGGFFKELFKGKEAFNAAKISLDALNKAYDSPELKSGVQSLLEMRVNLSDARKGYIDKDATLKEYNKTYGATFGIAKSINEAEKDLINGTSDYINALLQRAAATDLINQASADLVKRDKVNKERLLLDDAIIKRKLNRANEAYYDEADDFVLKKMQNDKSALDREVIDLDKSQKTKLALAQGYADKAAQFLKLGLGDDGSKEANEILKTQYEKLKIQIDELKTKIENGIYTEKNVSKDIALLAKLEQKVKDVEKAFSVLTGEDAELNFESAIKDSEAFLTEVGKQADDDLKDRRAKEKQSLQDKLTANKEYYLRLKEDAGDNQGQLDILNEKEIQGKINVYNEALFAGEDVKDKLIAAEEELRLARLGIAKRGAKERADLEKQMVQKSLDIASGVSSQFFDLKSNQLKAETDLEVKNLEEMRDKKLITEEQFKTKSAEIKNEAARKQREYDLAQIQVNTALAIIKALATAPTILAGIPLAALAGIEGAIQYAFASSQPLPQFAKGTERVTGGIAGKDSVHALLMPNEAVIPAKANMERQGLAKAWISGDLDNHLAMNYINPAINEVNRKWETSLRLNQQSTFIRNDNFSDKKIVGELVKSNRLNRALINSLSEGKTARRNKRIWN
jgi:hypothetical protein